MAATVAGASISLGVERSARHDGTTHAQSPVPPIDRWEATGMAYHLMVERDAGAAGMLRLTVHSTSANGALRLATDSVPSFRARERSTYTALELRTTLSARVRTLAALIAVDEERHRGDSVTAASTALRDRYPALVLSADYVLSDHAALLFGASGSWYRSAGEVPSHTTITAYEQLVAPEVALDASSMHTSASELGFRWRFGPRTFASVLVRRTSLSPDGFRQFDQLPDGQRTASEMIVRISTLP